MGLEDGYFHNKWTCFKKWGPETKPLTSSRIFSNGFSLSGGGEVKFGHATRLTVIGLTDETCREFQINVLELIVVTYRVTSSVVKWRYALYKNVLVSDKFVSQ